MADEPIPEMVERVARAISAERWGRSEQFDMESESWREAHRDMARAAIAAQREPTKAMIEAVPYDMYEPDFAENWRTMIDVALKH